MDTCRLATRLDARVVVVVVYLLFVRLQVRVDEVNEQWLWCDRGVAVTQTAVLVTLAHQLPARRERMHTHMQSRAHF